MNLIPCTRCTDAKRSFQISRVVTLTKKQEDILKTIDRKLLKAKESM